MKFHIILKSFVLLFASTLFWACNAQNPSQVSASEHTDHSDHMHGDEAQTFFINASGDTIHQVVKSSETWKAELTKQEYYVLREAGTERAFTGDLWDHKGTGVYTCAGCALPLFESSTKFKSGTGWPSYFQPIDPKHIIEHEDRSYGMVRVEVVCARCNGHLGHVFPDGPRPTGLRYCINSVSLDFEEEQP